MNKYILGIDGMGCGMCEVHVEETIRKNFKVKKVKASHIKNQAVVFIDQEIKEEDFKNALSPTGYRLTSYKKEVAKKSLFGWK